MKLLRCNPKGSLPRRRGAALLLSLLILLVLVAIVIQINVTTSTDARVARNDISLTSMDCAAESAILQVLETLKNDADAGADSAASTPTPGANGASATPNAGAQPGAQPAGGQQQQQACDSRRDEWANPQRTEINEIRLRIIVQDEDSKYNVLNMLNPDEKEAEAAFERVVGILDKCREGTGADIDRRTAEDMAKAMRDFMTKRKQTKLPKPKLLTDIEKNEDAGMPLSLREFMALPPFEESHFRDFRDEDNKVVSSITSFLTCWSSLQTAPAVPKSGALGSSGSSTPSGSSGAKGASGSSSSTSPTSSAGSKGGKSGAGTSPSGSPTSAQSGNAGASSQAGGNAASGAGGSAPSAGALSTSGGYGVNVNTAPSAVLKSLFDDREIHPRFWDKVIEYRNLEDESEKNKNKSTSSSSSSSGSGSGEDGAEQEQPQLDEYGVEIVKRKIFDSLAKLSEVEGYPDLPTEEQAKLNQILTTTSNVFSIYVVARKATSVEGDATAGLAAAEMRKLEETKGDTLVRVLHAVYWRQKTDTETKMVPILRWEILDYLPYEVLDFPPDDR